jgi:uncharacterized protein (TIGR03067 family)
MSEASSPNYDVFLSYSSRDKASADAACAVLERHGVRCWIAPRDIIPGDEWGAAIIKGINGSRMMVLIFSGHANASGQVHREVERAISRGMAVLPFRVEDVLPEGAMEFALSSRHWLDAFTPPLEHRLEELARSVKTLLGHDVGAIVSGPNPTPTGGPDRQSVDPGPAPVRSPRSLIRLAAALAAMLVVAIAAGWLTRSWDKTISSIDEDANPTIEPVKSTTDSVKRVIESAPRSDEDRIQGRWQGVDLAIPPAFVGKKSIGHTKEASKTFWTFHGRTLTITVQDAGEEKVRNEGSFSLSTGAERKLFDYVTTGPSSRSIAFSGIYEFDGEFLKVCYGIRLDPPNEPPESRRPDSFLVSGRNFRRTYLKFERVGD